MKIDNSKEQYRTNERIRVREVRLIGDNVEQGVYPTSQALKIAEDQGLDLVEISPNAAPPVCRVIDFQKFLYQQKKRQKEQKAKSVKVVVKEIRFISLSRILRPIFSFRSSTNARISCFFNSRATSQA